MSKIRTIYATNYSDMKLGGQKSMISLLENMNQDEFELHVICPEEGELSKRCREIGCKVHFHRVWSRRPKNMIKRIKSYYEFRRIMHENKIQVLHSDNEFDSFIYGRRLKSLNAKQLWHLRVAFKFKYDHIIQENADAIVGISESMKARISETNYHKYRTIYNGVDTDKFVPLDENQKLEIRNKLGMDDSFSILFVGQLKEGKGLYDLTGAFISLCKKQSNNPVKLYMLGSEIDKGIQAKLEAVVTKEIPEFKTSYIFPGHSDSIHEWMQAADILILPSHEGVEGMGRVLFEAMACGTPVIGTNIAGIRDAVTEETGYLVPEKNPEKLAEAIEKMRMDNTKYQEFKINCRKRAIEHFDIKIHARKISEVYKELANGETNV